MDNKLSKMEASEVLIDYFNSEIRSAKHQITERINQDSKDLHDRFEKLILEELTHEQGFFGKEGSLLLPSPEVD